MQTSMVDADVGCQGALAHASRSRTFLAYKHTYSYSEHITGRHTTKQTFLRGIAHPLPCNALSIENIFYFQNKISNEKIYY